MVRYSYLGQLAPASGPNPHITHQPRHPKTLRMTTWACVTHLCPAPKIVLLVPIWTALGVVSNVMFSRAAALLAIHLGLQLITFSTSFFGHSFTLSLSPPPIDQYSCDQSFMANRFWVASSFLFNFVIINLDATVHPYKPEVSEMLHDYASATVGARMIDTLTSPTYSPPTRHDIGIL